MYHRCFLFQKSSALAKTQRKRFLFWVWNLFWVVAASGCVGMLSMLLAPASYRVEHFISYLKNPWIFSMNVAPVILLCLLLYFAIGRATVAYWVTAAVVGIATAVNYFKLEFRNDPLMFEDITLWKEAQGMLGEYTITITPLLLGSFLAILCGGVFIHFFVRGRLSNNLPFRFLGLGLCIVVVFPLKNQLLDDEIYETYTANIEYINQWSATQIYYSKGFVYPFIYSTKSAFPTQPEGYDEGYAQELLAQYPSADIPPEEQVSVISIMLEAYADFSQYDIDGLSDKVYADYHALEEESYTGTLLTNIFAGGTVDSERCYLTGYANLRNFRSDTSAYPWYFQEQGYTVTGAHPCYEWFYNRTNINEYLGFETYWFVENYFSPLTDGGVGYDAIFFPALIDMWEENLETGQPLFAYNLSYQGHGPYDTSTYWWGDDYVVGDQYSQESLAIMNNYFGSIYDTNQYLVEFFDYYREVEEPVIIVLFGDHKPWMGDGNSVYTELGFTFDMTTQEGFYEYYSTSYLIWANDAAKETLGNDFVGDGPDISPTYLMNLVFQQAGWTGPSFLQATNEVLEQVPMINTATGLYLENGELTYGLTPEGQKLVDDFEMMEYYLQNNFIYEEIVS